MTDLAMQPSVAAAMVAIRCIAKSDSEIRIRDLIDTLDDSIGELQAGEMSRAEAMLFAQAHALQAMYVDLANRGIRSERMEHREANLRLALKAQNQCRMTLESLSNIKNPPVVIARQANISHGPQQVNNGTTPADPQGKNRRAHAANQSTRQNELLEVRNEQGLDTRPARASGRADSHMEAVGKRDRSAER
jgi:hypothetical protein